MNKTKPKFTSNQTKHNFSPKLNEILLFGFSLYKNHQIVTPSVR